MEDIRVSRGLQSFVSLHVRVVSRVHVVSVSWLPSVTRSIRFGTTFKPKNQVPSVERSDSTSLMEKIFSISSQLR